MANTKVQSEQIEDGAITAAKIADGAIVASEVADNAITTAKINADAVTGAKIADNAIDSEHYTDGSIDTAHIADDQVTQAKMANDSVGADELASSAVVTASIVDDAVTSAKLDTNIDIAGTFDVTGATTLDSTLAVAGATTILTNLSSDTTSTPDTVLTLSTKYASTGADGAAGAGSRLEFKIPDDETNPITGAAIAGIKEVADDSDASAGMAFYVSQNDTTLDEAVRIDHDGKVGIGTTSPAQTLHTSGTGVQRIEIDATDNNAAGAGLYMKVLNSGSLVGNATVRVDNVGNIDFFNGTSSESKKWTIGTNGHLKPAVDGYGINFEASKGAGESSTTLDDYEEGTWTPSTGIAGGSGSISFADDGNLLSYTKIGNIVFLTGAVEVAANSANAGRLNLGNLPFTPANGTDLSTRALVDARIEGGTGSQAGGYFCVINEGGSHFQIQTYTGITASNDSAVTMAVGALITITGYYQAA